jgi:hypothetical protein
LVSRKARDQAKSKDPSTATLIPTASGNSHRTHTSEPRIHLLTLILSEAGFSFCFCHPKLFNPVILSEVEGPQHGNPHPYRIREFSPTHASKPQIHLLTLILSEAGFSFCFCHPKLFNPVILSEVEGPQHGNPHPYRIREFSPTHTSEPQIHLLTLILSEAGLFLFASIIRSF